MTLYFILMYFLTDKFSHCLEPAFSQLALRNFEITDIRSHAFEDASTLAFRYVLNVFDTTRNLAPDCYIAFLRHFIIANVMSVTFGYNVFSRAFVRIIHYIF